MDKPIIFSGAMVRALLAGRKTQTRRLMPGQDYLAQAYSPIVSGTTIYNYAGEQVVSEARYAKADRLYVRENFQLLSFGDYLPTKSQPADVRFAATDPCADLPADTRGYPWRPCIFMPRWASRLTLLVDDVRVERLQEISEADAIAEGVPDALEGNPGDEIYCAKCNGFGVHGGLGQGLGVIEVDCADCRTAAQRYRNLWNSLHGVESWAANPFVVAVTFRVERANIDQLPPP